MNLPDSWREVRLGDVLHRVDDKVDPQRAIALTHFYVGLEHIESHTGRLLREAEDVTDSIDILSIKTAFQKGDLLYGKLRPNLNKVHLADQDGICSTDIWALRASDELNPEFGLHFLRSPAIHVRTSQLATGANLPRVSSESFDRISFPLPTLLEQQRIVDVLQQAEEVTQLQGVLDELLLKIKHQLFVEMFGDPNPKHNTSWPIIMLGRLVTVTTGGTPSREQADSYVGNIAWAKSTDLTDEAISSTEETITALGVQRSNAKVHPKHTILLAMYGQGQTRGRTAKLLIDAACNQACAALLPSDELLPDYLWVWLQLSYDAVRSLGRGGQQENLNLDIVRSLKLPKPPLHLQQEFARRLDQLLEVNANSRMARRQAIDLLKELSIEALTGTITEQWREQHSAEIAADAATRDALLRERGATFVSTGSKSNVHFTEYAPPERRTNFPRPRRQALIDQLSSFQHEVWNTLRYEWRGAVLADDPVVFKDFCTSPQTAGRLEGFDAAPINVRRALEQLATMGLVRKVSMPKFDPSNETTLYLTAFRPLREDKNGGRAEEDVALVDVASVQAELKRREKGGV